ncbi:hypothetical protein GCL60_07710 [Silvanigrella paludirubra]|uniref:Chorismate-utilising enzyme C-terminal domain-containing protein n=1 Tax=Silvanigrella paludirubra TaxID=2499159 RepID=A0A6N6VSW3_9BACT|nr:chorismate-binding protein [Silvanigrella paludirubra]KAB8038741.1 hypothetical protein GCL60_07710 [Silvanigrella paludirubra]
MNKNILNEFLESAYFIGSPNENKIWCMVSSFENYSFEEKITPPYFYLNNFYLSKAKPYCKGEVFFEMTYSEFSDFLQFENDEKPNIKWENVNKEYYLSKFLELKEEIKNNILKKAVPYSFINGNVKINKLNKLYLLKKLLENKDQKHSYIYGFWNKNTGFIGSSPELLFTQNVKNIHTIALAGTIPNNSSTNKNEFLLDPKMQKEHYYVIEGIKQSLNKFGKIKMGETNLLELPKLIHLKTDINIEIENQNLFQFHQFIDVIHPTPAIGSLPKNSQSNWLSESVVEHSNRGYYAAPFGVVLNDQKSICICTIRGIQWNEENIKICAGGGVIFESEFDLEWEEILSKINAIKHNLGI